MRLAGAGSKGAGGSRRAAAQAAKGLFVRSRGRVTGPFPLTTVQAMLRRRVIARFDQVSVDGKRWRLLSEVLAAAVEASHAEHAQREPAPAAPDPPPAQVEADATTGPTETGAHARATAARLRASESASDGALAAYEAELGEASRSPPAPTHWDRAIVGSGAVLLLFACLLPHARDSAGPSWWWDSTGEGSRAVTTAGAAALASALLAGAAALPLRADGLHQQGRVLLGAFGAAWLIFMFAVAPSGGWLPAGIALVAAAAAGAGPSFVLCQRLGLVRGKPGAEAKDGGWPLGATAAAAAPGALAMVGAWSAMLSDAGLDGAARFEAVWNVRLGVMFFAYTIIALVGARALAREPARAGGGWR